eukprot:4165127-Ditylum_brightwellii.AAC.1
MPYMVLLETDGGPDHSTIFLNTQLSLLAIFLLGEMDKLVGICCCPDPDMPKWLQEGILGDCSSMRMIHAAVDAYDKEHPKAVV